MTPEGFGLVAVNSGAHNITRKAPVQTFQGQGNEMAPRGEVNGVVVLASLGQSEIEMGNMDWYVQVERGNY